MVIDGAGGEGGGASEEAKEAEAEKEAEETGPEIFDVNSYDDDAHKAALKMQQAGRGMLARKHVNKYIEMKFSEAVADVTAEKLWEVLGDFGAEGILTGGWYEAIKDKGENKLGSQRTVVPARGCVFLYFSLAAVPAAYRLSCFFTCPSIVLVSDTDTNAEREGERERERERERRRRPD